MFCAATTAQVLLCMELWCSSIEVALGLQETRTLATYNVEGGVWHGPTRFVVPMDAPAPKQAIMA